MFLGTFYYTTSESKLPTSFQFLPCFLPFFPLPRARARQVVFFFCLHSFTQCAHLVAAQWNRGEGFCVSPFTFSCVVLGSCRLSIFTGFLLTRWADRQARADAPEGEGFLNKVFTHIVLNHSEMRRVCEGVKAKNEKCLTRARARTGARRRKNGRRTKTKNGRSRDGERP